MKIQFRAKKTESKTYQLDNLSEVGESVGKFPEVLIKFFKGFAPKTINSFSIYVWTEEQYEELQGWGADMLLNPVTIHLSSSYCCEIVATVTTAEKYTEIFGSTVENVVAFCRKKLMDAIVQHIQNCNRNYRNLRLVLDAEKRLEKDWKLKQLKNLKEKQSELHKI